MFHGVLFLYYAFVLKVDAVLSFYLHVQYYLRLNTLGEQEPQSFERNFSEQILNLEKING